MKNQALQYYMHDGPSAFRFELAGELTGEGAHRLDRDWKTAASVTGRRSLFVDLTFVTGAEEEGRALLRRWHTKGAQLIAKSAASRALVEEILGVPVADINPPAHSKFGQTWLPFHISAAAPVFSTLVLLALLFAPSQMFGANLQPGTVTAWNEYVHSAHHALEDRVRPGGKFLWARETAERAAQLHAGEVVVAAAPGQIPRKINGGLIHHWVGAAFLPGVGLDEVLDVTRDYDRYKEFYRPSVIDSQVVARDGTDDKFSMQLRNKSVFLKNVLDADYRASNVRLDGEHYYCISQTTRVQEIADPGQPGQRMNPEGVGSGYIWKLFSVIRLEQADGGVYVEMEAIALSREIPAALHPFVDPIVRRVSRNSMISSLQQTADAVRSRSMSSARNAGTSAPAGHFDTALTALPPKTSAFASFH